MALLVTGTILSTAQVFAPRLNVNLPRIAATLLLFAPRVAYHAVLPTIAPHAQAFAPPTLVLIDPPPTLVGQYIVRAGAVMSNSNFLDHLSGTEFLSVDVRSHEAGGPSGGTAGGGPGIHGPSPATLAIHYKGDNDAVFTNVWTGTAFGPYTPSARIDLPSGFTPLTAQVKVICHDLFTAMRTGNPAFADQVYLQFDQFTEVSPRDPGDTPNNGINQYPGFFWNHPLDPVPSLDDLIFYGFGVRLEMMIGTLPSVVWVQIQGTYGIVETTLTTTIHLPAWAASTAQLRVPSIVRGPAPAPPLQHVGGSARSVSTVALFTPSVVLQYPPVPGGPGGPGSGPPDGPPVPGTGCAVALPIDPD